MIRGTEPTVTKVGQGLGAQVVAVTISMVFH